MKFLIVFTLLLSLGGCMSSDSSLRSVESWLAANPKVGTASAFKLSETRKWAQGEKVIGLLNGLKTMFVLVDGEVVSVVDVTNPIWKKPGFDADPVELLGIPE